MVIQQISVFVENKPGTLTEILDVLKEHGINLKAITVADTEKFGILRMIVNETEKTAKILREEGFAVKITPVLCVSVKDAPGNLHEQIQLLSAAGINIEYMYAFGAIDVKAAKVVLKVDDLVRAQGVMNKGSHAV